MLKNFTKKITCIIYGKLWMRKKSNGKEISTVLDSHQIIKKQEKKRPIVIWSGKSTLKQIKKEMNRMSIRDFHQCWPSLKVQVEIVIENKKRKKTDRKQKRMIEEWIV